MIVFNVKAIIGMIRAFVIPVEALAKYRNLMEYSYLSHRIPLFAGMTGSVRCNLIHVTKN